MGGRARAGNVAIRYRRKEPGAQPVEATAKPGSAALSGQLRSTARPEARFLPEWKDRGHGELDRRTLPRTRCSRIRAQPADGAAGCKRVTKLGVAERAHRGPGLQRVSSQR